MRKCTTCTEHNSIRLLVLPTASLCFPFFWLSPFHSSRQHEDLVTAIEKGKIDLADLSYKAPKLLPRGVTKHFLGTDRHFWSGSSCEVVWLVWFYSPNRFPCVGFLLLWNRCMLGPHDFTFVSGLVFCQRHWTPLYRMISGLSPTPTCLPLVSQYTLDALSALVRMFSHLSPTRLGLSPTTPSILCLHDFTLVSQYTLDALSALVAVYRRVCRCSCHDCCLRSLALICVSLTVWFANHGKVCCCSCRHCCRPPHSHSYHSHKYHSFKITHTQYLYIYIWYPPLKYPPKAWKHCNLQCFLLILVIFSGGDFGHFFRGWFCSFLQGGCHKHNMLPFLISTYMFDMF